MNIKELEYNQLSNYLKSFGIELNNIVDIQSAGDGNMNITLRVTNETGDTLILKQSPPYCEKYPSIPAPESRVLSEAQFYQIANEKLADNNYFPKLKHIDQKNFIISMEDLGTGSDYSDLYQNKEIVPSDLKYIINALNDLHRIEVSDSSLLKNTEMRKLNHEYIFVQPLERTDLEGLDAITPGLGELSKIVASHNGYKAIVRELGKRYLNDGMKLCHGDFYPASWLKTESGISIIDPEFAFIGLAEFDYGVLYAHLLLSNQNQPIIRLLNTEYKKHEGFNQKLAHQYAGIEVMRRIIGVAQLPLKADLAQKESWLKRSLDLVLKGE